jgi:diguanylate cyclase (GGDEF)-like protein/PAS domain S-box-containing protein
MSVGVCAPVLRARLEANLVDFSEGLVNMSAHNNFRNNREIQSPETSAFHRRRSLYVLFLHRDANTIDLCTQALAKGQFTVRSDSVLNLQQCREQLRSQSYDVIVVEYPSPSCNGLQLLQLLHQTVQDVPLVFLSAGIASEPIEDLTTVGAFDYVEEQHLSQLPMAVRRVLNEKKLRIELEEAGKALRHSESLYRALVENPAYGICRCDAEGKFLSANQALLTMLGYSSVQEFLTAKRADIALNLGQVQPTAGSPHDSVRVEPMEIEWKRQNGTFLKARLSGRGVFDEHGRLGTYEIIVVDVTEQRALEDHLRRQAWSDSLTGLANHGRLFEVLNNEISRSKRTAREFSVVLLDLDGLKEINDREGHLVGNRALCRLAQILKDCCRSIDTAARQGGDEFALVLPESTAQAATLVAKRVCDLLSKDPEEPRLSVSAGIASYPRDADSIGSLLNAADKNLYAMKQSRPKPAKSAQVA